MFACLGVNSGPGRGGTGWGWCGNHSAPGPRCTSQRGRQGAQPQPACEAATPGRARSSVNGRVMRVSLRPGGSDGLASGSPGAIRTGLDPGTEESSGWTAGAAPTEVLATTPTGEAASVCAPSTGTNRAGLWARLPFPPGAQEPPRQTQGS